MSQSAANLLQEQLKKDFRPLYSREQTAQLVQLYNMSPRNFNSGTTDQLRNHANHYQINFVETPEHTDASVKSVMKNYWGGLISGFTTFETQDEPPKNEIDAIARNLGHLMGFAGVMPIPAVGKFTRVAQASKILRGRSVPFLAAKAAKKAIEGPTRRIFSNAHKARVGATQDALGFLQNEIVGDLAEGAFNLGVASAVSSWQQGIDAMIQSGLGGAAAGALFRGIGNAVKVTDPKTGKPAEWRKPGTPWKELSESQRSEMALKALSGSLLMGLPATLRGATTAEQIYEYLLGAYFGGNELSVRNRQWLKFEASRNKARERGGSDIAELVEGWDSLPRSTQKFIKARDLEQLQGGREVSSLSAMLMGADLPGKRAAEKWLTDQYGNKLLNQGKGDLKAESHKVSEAEANKMTNDPVGSNKTENEIRQDLDPSDSSTTRPEHNPVRFIDNFVTKELETAWKDKNPDLAFRKKLEVDKIVEDKWYEMVRDGRGEGEPPGRNMINWIEGEYNIKMSEPSKRTWIQRGHKNLKEREVRLLSPEVVIDGNGQITSQNIAMLPEGSINKAGVRKVLFEEPKIVDKEWRAARLRHLMEQHTRDIAEDILSKENSGYVMDHVVVQGKNMKPKSMSLEDFKAQLWKDTYKQKLSEISEREWDRYQIAVAEADKAFNNFLGKVMTDAHKHGYYYFGGRGASPKLYFQKLHPGVPRYEKGIDAAFTKARETIEEYYKGLSDKEKMRFLEPPEGYDEPIPLKQLSTILKGLNRNIEFGLSLKQGHRIYKEGFLSNILYEMGMNGFSTVDGTGKGFTNNIKRLMGRGFIKNSKDLNKRMQIWFSSGNAASPREMISLINERGKGGIGSDGNLKVVFAKEANDPDSPFYIKKSEMNEFTKATSHPETTDGSILIRSDVIDSYEQHWGMFGVKRDGSREYSGLNKSFIVSPNETYGAVLGKYQFRDAGKTMSEIMRKRGIHMIVNNSSAKQIGERKSFHYDLNKKETDFIFKDGKKSIKNPDIYDIKVEHLKGIFSEKQDYHFYEPQRFPKQMQSTLVQDAPGSNINPDTIRDLHETLAGRSFEGEPEANAILPLLRKKPGNEKLHTEILDKFEDLGVNEVMSILQNPKEPVLRAKILQKMMRFNEDHHAIMQGAAEKDPTQYRHEMIEDQAWNTAIDRLIPMLKDNTALFDHKAFREYKGVTVRNFVINKLTQPRMRNSAVARMIEYDPVLRRRFPELNKKDGDKWFFLDDYYKNMRVYSERWTAPMTLEKLYESTQRLASKKNRTEQEDNTLKEDLKIFEAVVMRVPMDSISGAHVLKFGGFTGRRGYGILLHPRTMRALGGADLDGDKAHLFFGGRSASGEGHGMKESWKEMYRSNKEEHYINTGNGITKVISGGQIGVDQASLEWAQSQNIQTGGKMPLGFRTRAHDNLWKGKSSDKKKWKSQAEEVLEKPGIYDKEGAAIASKYNLAESEIGDYSFRTLRNVQESHGTIAWGNTTGTLQTVRMAKSQRKPVLHNPKNAQDIYEFIRDNDISILNMAGSSNAPPKLIKKIKSQMDEVMKIKPPKGRVIIDSKSKADNFRQRDFESDMESGSTWSKWSPYWRFKMSEAAWEGRGKMGYAVINRNILSSAHSTLKEKDAGVYTYTGEVPSNPGDIKSRGRKVNVEYITNKGEEVIPHLDENGNHTGQWILISATNDPTLIKSFNQKARSAISIMADAMDESGIVHTKEIWRELARDLFGFKLMKPNRKGNGLEEVKGRFGEPVEAPTGAISFNPEGTIGKMANINTAAYGKNRALGRRWRSYDLRDKFSLAEDFKNPNNLLAMIGKRLSTFDMSDGPFRRQNEAEIRATYDKHQAYLREMGGNYSAELQAALGRTSLGVTIKENSMKDLVLKEKLWLYENRTELATNQDKFLSFMKKISDKNRYKELFARKDYDPKKLNLRERKEVIDDIIRKAEDFYIADLVDMASIKHIDQAYRRYLTATGKEQDLEVLNELSALSSRWKKESAVEANDRNKQILTGLTYESEVWGKEEFNRQVERGEITLEPTSSAAIDNRKLSMIIKAQKEAYAKEEGGIEKGDLLDALLLSSLRRKNHPMIDSISKQKWKDPEYQKEVLDYLNRESLNTSISTLAFSLPAVNPRNIKEHMTYFEEAFKSGQKNVSPKDVETIIEKIKDKQQIEFKDGTTTQADIIEDLKFAKLENKYLDEILPFKGLNEKTDAAGLKGEAAKVWGELQGWINHYHNSLFLTGRKKKELIKKKSGLGGATLAETQNMNRFNLFIRGIVQKDLKDMKLEDWKTINRWFEVHSKGSWIQQLRKNKDDRDVPQYAAMMFPEAISRDQMKFEFELADSYGVVFNNHGKARISKVLQPTHTTNQITAALQATAEMSTQAHQKLMLKLQNELVPYVHSIPEGSMLFEMAVRIRERGEKYSIEFALEDKFANKLLYETNYREAAKEHNWAELKDKVFNINIGGGKTQKMTGMQVTKAINKVITEQLKEGFEMITGDWTWVKENFGIRDNYGKFKEISKEDGTVQIDINKFIAFVNDAYVNNKPLPIEKIGVDGLRKIIKAYEFQDAVRRANYYKKDVIFTTEGKQLTARQYYTNVAKQIKTSKYARVKDTESRDPDTYYPHMHELLSRKQATKYLESMLDRITNSNMSRDDKVIKIAEIRNSFFGKVGEWSRIKEPLEEGRDVIWEGAKAAEMAKKPDQNYITVLKNNPMTGSMFQRKWHMPGWSVQPESMDLYFKKIYQKFHSTIGQLQAQDMITQFRFNHYKELGPELTNRWEDFFRLLTVTGQGQPTVIPESMKDARWVKGTPYSFYTDGVVANRLQKIVDKLGLRGKNLPPELDEINSGKIDPWKLAHWAKLEARYSLASLLAHPKSSVGNLYGGSVMTVINTGFDNWRFARDLKYVRANIDSKFKTREDLNQWMKELGVQEEFLIEEVGLTPKFRQKKWKKFSNEAIEAIKRNPELDDTNLFSIAKKHGITKAALEKAGAFMQYPERALRRDAFLAHYIHYKNKLGGAITERDHPLLIKIAKEGVKRTQFLYSAPNRPLIARTALGKVWTRFQLWAWNAVRMQNDIMREADIYGFKEGTDSFERAKRFLIADAMMMGLANVFAYSLFDAALPPPMSWIQDFADIMFGDEKERERAFFGQYPSPLQPLQLITPPSARLLPATFKSIVEDDWSRMGNYHVWTALPFGRILKDVVGPGSIIKNPVMTLDKLTGIPAAMGMSYVKKEKPKRTPFFGWVWDGAQQDVVEADEED